MIKRYPVIGNDIIRLMYKEFGGKTSVPKGRESLGCVVLWKHQNALLVRAAQSVKTSDPVGLDHQHTRNRPSRCRRRLSGHVSMMQSCRRGRSYPENMSYMPWRSLAI